MRQCLPFPDEIRHMVDTAKATQLRVTQKEARHGGGHYIHIRAQTMRGILHNCNNLRERRRWYHWYTQRITSILGDTAPQLELKHITLLRSRSTSRPAHNSHSPEKVDKRVNAQFQQGCFALLRRASNRPGHVALVRLQHKLGKWARPLAVHKLSNRAYDVTKFIAQHTNPRSHSSPHPYVV